MLFEASLTGDSECLKQLPVGEAWRQASDVRCPLIRRPRSFVARLAFPLQVFGVFQNFRQHPCFLRLGAVKLLVE